MTACFKRNNPLTYTKADVWTGRATYLPYLAATNFMCHALQIHMQIIVIHTFLYFDYWTLQPLRKRQMHIFSLLFVLYCNLLCIYYALHKFHLIFVLLCYKLLFPYIYIYISLDFYNLFCLCCIVMSRRSVTH
jgi:hypothetical protein